MNQNLNKLKKHFYCYYKTKTKTGVGSYNYRQSSSSCHSQWMSVFNVDTDPQNKICNQLKDKAIKLFSQKEDDRGMCYTDKYNIWYNVDIRCKIDKIFKAYQSAKDKDLHKQRENYIEMQKQKYMQNQTNNKAGEPGSVETECKIENEDNTSDGSGDGSNDDSSDDSSESSSNTDSSIRSSNDSGNSDSETEHKATSSERPSHDGESKQDAKKESKEIEIEKNTEPNKAKELDGVPCCLTN